MGIGLVWASATPHTRTSAQSSRSGFMSVLVYCPPWLFIGCISSLRFMRTGAPTANMPKLPGLSVRVEAAGETWLFLRFWLFFFAALFSCPVVIGVLGSVSYAYPLMAPYIPRVVALTLSRAQPKWTCPWMMNFRPRKPRVVCFHCPELRYRAALSKTSSRAINSCPRWNLPRDPSLTPLPKTEAERLVPQTALLAFCGRTFMVTQVEYLLQPYAFEIWKSAIPSLFKSSCVT